MSELAQRLRNDAALRMEMSYTDLTRWRPSALAMLENEAAAELDRLTAEVAGLKADAERYRWVREQFKSFHDGQYPGYSFRCTVLLMPDKNILTVDAAVDAARAALAAQEPTAQEQK